MPRETHDAEAALEKLGSHLRLGWAKRHPVSEKTLESVGNLVREKWELEQQANRTTSKPSPSKDKSPKPPELEP